MSKRTKREERRDKLTLYYYYDYSRLAFRRCREHNNDDRQTCVQCLCMYVSIKTVV